MSDYGILRVITHLVDGSVGMPIISTQLMDVNDVTMSYVEQHLLRTLDSDDIKEVEFASENGEMVQRFKNYESTEENFIHLTKVIAEDVFEVISNNDEVPSGALTFVEFSRNGMLQIAMIKFDYQVTYTHHLENSEEVRSASIIKYKSTLPGLTQRVKEFVAVNTKTMKVYIRERAFQIDGEKQFYLSGLLFDTTYNLTLKRNVDIVVKEAKKAIEHYFAGDVMRIGKTKQLIANSIMETGEVDIEMLKDEVFDSSDNAYNEFKTKIAVEGIQEDTIKGHDKISERLIKKQRIVLDNGIEIKVPLELLEDKDFVEFVTKDDGTIALHLKNITDFVGK